MSVRQASTALIAQRSVHLRIVPRPVNLSEGREILRVLQRFGPMDIYKHLKFEYHNPMDNVAIGIYRDADSAQQALNASPIRFALEKLAPQKLASEEEDHFDDIGEEDKGMEDATQNIPDKGVDDILRPSKLLNSTLTENASLDSARIIKPTLSSSTENPPSSAPLPFEPSNQSPQTVSKWFQITVDRSRTVHHDYIEKQNYWQKFAPMKSIAQTDLSEKVPHLGLSDVSKRPPNAHRVNNRALRTSSRHDEEDLLSLRRMFAEAQTSTDSKRP